MGEMKNLFQDDAIAKMKQIATGEIAMLGTFAPDQSFYARPMGTLEIDDDGTFWFFSQDESEKNRQIKEDETVHLVYAVSAKSEYLSIQGRASISRDRARIERLWTVFAKTWFTEGKDDPRITLIKVTPTGGHYWDTKHNKMVQLAMIAFGAMTGKTTDDGVHGALKV